MCDKIAVAHSKDTGIVLFKGYYILYNTWTDKKSFKNFNHQDPNFCGHVLKIFSTLCGDPEMIYSYTTIQLLALQSLICLLRAVWKLYSLLQYSQAYFKPSCIEFDWSMDNLNYW